MARKVLLVCGILSSLLYVAMTVFVPMRWEGYSSASQAVSELSAIGAPTRPIWVLLGIVYTLLFAAFGWGVRQSAVGNRSLRVVGGLIIAYSAVNLFWPPMHLRGTELSLTDTLHIVWTVMVILFMMLMMGFGAAALGKTFRLYTIASMVLLVVLGALTGIEGPRIAANLPTPWVGVWQRIMIAAFLLWVVVLAVTVLRIKKDDGRRSFAPAARKTQRGPAFTRFTPTNGSSPRRRFVSAGGPRRESRRPCPRLSAPRRLRHARESRFASALLSFMHIVPGSSVRRSPPVVTGAPRSISLLSLNG